ncbi:sugar acetylase [Pseudomonas fluorescens]|uniref:Sugar acetylase n=1 Tax=Pseudomonas fluorescens TaxID=294 RepID=A0A448DU48_PSEFL|nr:acyltransferase [Pseudomonas fluorescens]VEF10333.1 sugar acetylase [Pseudomonas fluorescens]
MKRIEGRIVFLDYMRIFAFISVLIGHKFYIELLESTVNPNIHSTLKVFISLLLPVTAAGGAGVVVFFLTSGYIITHVLSAERPVEFLIKRVFRIYPLYAFAVIMQVLLESYVQGISMPSLGVLIPRLLLIGDFLGTPMGLGGVEWTLRIEVVFYLFMALLSWIGCLSVPKVMPLIYVLTTLSLYLAQPFPSAPGLSLGYFTLYAPFLFIGSLIYLAHVKLISAALSWFAGALIVLVFLLEVPVIQPNWKDQNFAVLAIAIFMMAYSYMDRLADGALIRLLSNLTYSVYLFHNWIWGYVGILVDKVGVLSIPRSFQILVVLFVLCYLAHRTIERYGLHVGKKALAIYNEKNALRIIARQ